MFMSRHDDPTTADPSRADARFSVRRARVTDAPAFARTMAHPEVYANLLQMPWPTDELWQARLADMTAPGKADVLLVAEAGDQLVGMAGLHPTGVSPRRRHVMALG